MNIKKITLLTSCLMLSGLMLSGCSKDSNTFVQKEYTASGAQIDDISIDVRDRQIDVSLSKDNDIHITYFEDINEGYNIAVSDNHTLIMTGISSKSWTDYIDIQPSIVYRTISLQIPDALLDQLELSTTNEDISLPSLTVSDGISLSSNGGSINFDALDVGSSLCLSAKNGNIVGAVIGSCDDFTIQTNIKKGESNLPATKPDGDKSLKAACNNGNVNIEFIGKRP